MTALLAVRGLDVTYDARHPLRGVRQRVQAVTDVDLDVPAGHTVALVGESGCGKSSTARAIVGLITPARGTITLDGRPMARTRRSRATRKALQLVFQDPTASLNPRRLIGDSITEPLRGHGHPSRPARERAAVAACADVGLEPGVLGRYPHELSGGQRQRAALARALICQPRVLICDEPTSDLDLSVQAQILNLLGDLQRQRGLGILLITHDLAVVRHLSVTVAVMYLGRIVETAPTAAFFQRAAHPYSQALLASIPSAATSGRTPPLRGDPPSPLQPPGGCPFHPRCPLTDDRCRSERPRLRGVLPGQVACHQA